MKIESFKRYKIFDFNTSALLLRFEFGRPWISRIITTNKNNGGTETLILGISEYSWPSIVFVDEILSVGGMQYAAIESSKPKIERMLIPLYVLENLIKGEVSWDL